MQFKVPQNVQREDTIVGPLTLKQLIILAFGGGIAYTIYVSLAVTYYVEIWLPPVGLVAAITMAFAFLKVHNMSFHIFLMRLAAHFLVPRKRKWMKGADSVHIELTAAEKNQIIKPKTIINNQKSFDKIDEITKILDNYGNTLTQLSTKK